MLIFTVCRQTIEIDFLFISGAVVKGTYERLKLHDKLCEKGIDGSLEVFRLYLFNCHSIVLFHAAKSFV